MTTSIVSGHPSVDPDSRSARIIQFPARPKPAAPAPEDRLAKALEALNTAMADQRTAMTAWRGVLAELKTSATSLEDSLQRYRSSLRTLGASVSSLHAKARSLEQWADGVASATE